MFAATLTSALSLAFAQTPLESGRSILDLPAGQVRISRTRADDEVTYPVGEAVHRAAADVAVAQAVSGQRAEDDREIHGAIEGTVMPDA